MLNREQESATLRVPLPVVIPGSAVKVNDAPAESHVLTGVAGTAGNFVLTYAPVSSADGTRVGKFGDTSLSFDVSLTTEIPYQQAYNRYRLAVRENKADPYEPNIDLTSILANGEFYVIYETGKVYYKESTVDIAVVPTYKYRTQVLGTVVVDSEFPAAAADADAKANPNTTSIKSHLSGFNGTTWDRLRSGVKTLAATLTGYLNTLPFAVYNAVPTVRTEGQGGPLQADQSGNLKVISAGGGGSAGGGNNTYSTEQGDFTATPTDATFAIVLNVDSVGGVALTAANFANAILKIMDVSLTPDEYKTVSLDKFTWTAATKTLDITNCTGAFTLGTGDIVSLTLVGTDKMRDSGTDAQRAILIRDVSDQYVVSEIVNTTNVATGTYYYGTMDGYEDLSFCGTLIDGAAETTTLTLEVSNVGGTTAADWMKVYFRDDMLNTNVNEMAVTNATKYFACSAPGIGSFKEYRYLITTTASTNTVKITEKRVF